MNTKPIRLGLLPPLSGLVEIYGPEIVRAAQLAVAEINQAGGVLGRPLELLIEDDGSLPQTAVPAAHRLVDAGCVAIIGNLLSNSRIAVAEQVADPRHVPYLNFSFYEGSIAARHFFHFAALPNQQIDLMIPWMAKEYGPKMFFAGNNYEWPRGSIDAAKRALLTAGGDVVDEVYLPIGCSADEIETLLERVGNAGADVFVPYFAGADQIALLTRFAELGLKKRMAVVMGHYDEVMVSRLPVHVREGLYSSNTYFMSVKTPENEALLERLACYPGVNGLWPQGDGVLSNFGEGTYVCVKAFAAAAGVALRTSGSLASADLLPALEQVSIEAPQGRVTMDAATHHAQVNGYLARCRADGGFDIVVCFGCLPPEIPARYRQSGLSALPKALDARTAAMEIGTAQQILTVADVAVLATDVDGVIVEASPQAAEMFGYTLTELHGMSVQLLLPPHLRTAHAAHMAGFLASATQSRRMRERGEVVGYRKDGSFFSIEASIAKVQTKSGWLLVATLQDVTQRKRVEEELVWKATHDVLTGLPNRALIRERLTNALQRSRRQSESVGLLFVDLDGFKAINDSHGHEQGDALLKQVAARLVNEVRPGDTVGRLAGDEFIVLCEQIKEAVALSTLAERLNDALRQPVLLPNGREVTVAASIGVAVGHGSTHSPDDLLRNADTAMYAAKERGRDGWQFFSEGIEAAARQRVVIINGLRKALENNEFSIRLQPIVAIDGQRVVGAETLLRWHAPLGDVSPAVFIPVAESTGAIVAIGAWVFRQACRVAAGWRAQFGNEAPYVSVNVSTRQLDTEDLVETFSAILADTGARPADLLIEVTETALMANVEASLHTLRRLADLGMRVAVDDFGTGYSSFAQLLRLPVSVLKIDRAFVDGIDTRDEIRIVASAIVRLAHTLGHKVVAEGVETEAQLTELQAIGCDNGQGYLFDRPLEEAPMLARITTENLVTATGSHAPIFYLIYISEESTPIDAATLTAIKQQSVVNNRQTAVTGMLIHQSGYFLQMLEGDPQRVRWLMEKIRHDPRHCRVRTVIEGTSDRRYFSSWSMGVRDLGAMDSRPEFSALPPSRGLLTLAEDPRICYDFFRAFAERAG